MNSQLVIELLISHSKNQNWCLARRDRIFDRGGSMGSIARKFYASNATTDITSMAQDYSNELPVKSLHDFAPLTNHIPVGG